VSDESNLGAVRVMVRYNNGDPALVERQVGLGHVILAASSAGRLWNDLPLQSSYVPLIYQLMFYLGQGATSHRNLRLDEPLFLALAHSPDQIRAMVSRARYGAEIWYSLICAVIGLLFVESFLAQKFGRRG